MFLEATNKMKLILKFVKILFDVVRMEENKHVDAHGVNILSLELQFIECMSCSHQNQNSSYIHRVHNQSPNNLPIEYINGSKLKQYTIKCITHSSRGLSNRIGSSISTSRYRQLELTQSTKNLKIVGENLDHKGWISSCSWCASPPNCFTCWIKNQKFHLFLCSLNWCNYGVECPNT